MRRVIDAGAEADIAQDRGAAFDTNPGLAEAVVFAGEYLCRGQNLGGAGQRRRLVAGLIQR